MFLHIMKITVYDETVFVFILYFNTHWDIIGTSGEYKKKFVKEGVWENIFKGGRTYMLGLHVEEVFKPSTHYKQGLFVILFFQFAVFNNVIWILI